MLPEELVERTKRSQLHHQTNRITNNDTLEWRRIRRRRRRMRRKRRRKRRGRRRSSRRKKRREQGESTSYFVFYIISVAYTTTGYSV